MLSSDWSPLRFIEWGFRLLWLMLFLAIIVIMGYWTSIYTFLFIGAIFSCLCPILSSQKEMLDPWDYSYLLDEEMIEYDVKKERVG